MYSALLTLLLLPLLALAQTTASNTNTNTASNASTTPAPSSNATAAAAPQNTTVVFTSVTTSVGFGPGRVETTLVSTRLITSVMPVATSNATTSNSTEQSTTTSPTTTIILPTAPVSIDGGGVGGAPSPGANSNNGAFGPDDSYIAAATTLAKQALAVTLAASLVGGVLVVL